jgi:hypothetical protein
LASFLDQRSLRISTPSSSCCVTSFGSSCTVKLRIGLQPVRRTGRALEPAPGRDGYGTG